MDLAKDVRKGETLDWDKLEKYLKANISELEGVMSVGQFHGGHANLTYLIQFGDQEFVLRRPPFGKIAPGAHDMKREFNVLSKLYAYYSEAPKAYHFCDNTAIIGAPFVLVERRTGVIIRKKMVASLSHFDHVEERVANAMVRTLADLHQVDYKKADLANLGKPEGFLERQLRGWTKRWTLSKLDPNPDMDTVLDILQENIPTSQGYSIIHNDMKLDNCQFQIDNPDKVTSVFDWDMCTIGDPLFDFATALAYWPDETIKKLNLPIIVQGDFPTKDFMKEKYAEYTGYDLSRINWYEALAHAKNVVIAQQLYARFKQGDSSDPRMEMFGFMTKFLSKTALRTLKS